MRPRTIIFHLTVVYHRFLLVRLMMVRLKAQRTPSKLRGALDTLPSDLYAMYEQTIRRSPDPECTLRLLFWVYFAQHRLSPPELVHAVAWTLQAAAPLSNQDLEDEGRLLSGCGGMVEVRQRTTLKGRANTSKGHTVFEVVFTRESLIFMLATRTHVVKIIQLRNTWQPCWSRSRNP